MKKRGFAAIPVLLVLAIALAVGGYFYFRSTGQVRTTPQERAFQLELDEIRDVGEPTTVEGVEAELEATSYTEIDSDLADLESELNAALQE